MPNKHFVPRHILNTVYGLANFATRVPVHQSWVHPALLKAYCYWCYKKKRILIVNYNRITVIQNRCNFLFSNLFFLYKLVFIDKTRIETIAFFIWWQKILLIELTRSLELTTHRKRSYLVSNNFFFHGYLFYL